MEDSQPRPNVEDPRNMESGQELNIDELHPHEYGMN
jgi:hypothetical protein